jgi:competence ComEA-like helix-hairpin-helix protein
MKTFPKHLTTVLTLAAVLLCSFPALAADKPAPDQVNINTATAEQLALLPRIGPSLAGRVIAFREENGEFKSTDDLLLVSGIGEKTFVLLELFVKTSGDTTLSAKLRTSEVQARLAEATADPKSDG